MTSRPASVAATARRTPVPDTAARVDPPLPVGFGIQLDPSARALTPELWFGGSPSRVLRLSAAGRSALLRLRAEGVRDVTTGRLARKFTDAGLAQPVPPAPARALDLTVLVPVLDRPDALARCLGGLTEHFPVVVVDDGSRDAGAIAAVTRAHGARLVRREIIGGPAVARNTGLGSIDTEYVAFLDSDCVPPRGGWVEELARQLADPLVAAAAPRITSSLREGWTARYLRSRGALDLGVLAGRVVPRSRIAYVPTAALVVRVSALASVSRQGYVFDPALRFGEDVDLIWRLHRAGWRIRYDPAVVVEHRDPDSWRALLYRRFCYGTSAAPLGRAHPEAVAPLIVYPLATATLVALLSGRPAVAGLAFAAMVHTRSKTLRAARVPTAGTTRAMAGAVGRTWLGLGRYLTQFGAPALAVGALVRGRPARRLAMASMLLGPSVAAWVPNRRALDPIRFVAAHLADEVAYGTGVWAGCLRHRTLRPLRPALMRTGATCHAHRRGDLT